MSSMEDKLAPVTRMASSDRRELVLTAATEVFGQYGYAGTTTDKVATAAGVSQPYVVRIFGTKEKLFLEVLRRALNVMLVSFRAAIADTSDVPLGRRMGLAYVDLLQDRGLLLSLMHGFVLGTDPVIGELARCGFLEIYNLLKDEAGMSPAEANDFMAHGMMLNTLVGIRMTDEYESNPGARELLDESFGGKLDVLLATTPPAPAS